MGTIKDVQMRFSGFFNGFENAVIDAMESNADLVEETIQEQLASGLNGDEKPLRPTYTNDPWFNTEAAGHWKGKAKAYMKWKAKITPPARSWLGFPERDKDTPNLYIVGMFYASIKAKRTNKGLMIESNIPMGKDIEKKYGSIILKPGRTARGHFVKYHLVPSLKAYYAKWGLL